MELGEYLANASLLLIGGLLTFLFGLLQPESRLVYWQPHSFTFYRPKEGGALRTQICTVQNLGRKSCEHVEIVHKYPPENLQLQPERHYAQLQTPSGEHVIYVESLGPKEFFSFEIMTTSPPPALLCVRCKDGPATPIQFMVQQVQPRWKTWFAVSMILTGTVTVIYWLMKGFIRAYGAVSP